MMNNFYISVIIPTFNGKELLRQNLPNVVRVLSDSGLMFEIIVVDDASTDETILFLAENYPDIRSFRNETNSGFSKTMNRGIAEAKYDWILSLNNDMRLPDGFFDSITPLLTDTIFSVSCTIKDGQGIRTLESSKLLKLSAGAIRSKDAESQQPVYSLYSCGGCAVYNRAKLLELGGFDEIFTPFYYEDMDLGLKAWLRGWQSIYTPGTFCYHDHSVTIKTKFKQFFVKKTINRNKLFLQSVYLNGLSLALFLCMLFLKFLYSLILLFIPKRKAFVLAFIELMAMRKGLISKRKLIKQTAVSSLEELIKIIGTSAN